MLKSLALASALSVTQFQWLQSIDPGLADVVYEAVHGNNPDAADMLESCASTAEKICGAGKVCYTCVCGVPQSCSWGCQDEQGHCQPAPPCCPKSLADDLMQDIDDDDADVE